MKKKVSLILKVICPTILTIMVGAVILIGTILYLLSGTANTLTNDLVDSESSKIVDNLTMTIQTPEMVTKILAETIFGLVENMHDPAETRNQIKLMLKNTVSNVNAAFGACVAFESNIIGTDTEFIGDKLSTNTGRFVPYMYKLNGKVLSTTVENNNEALDKADYYRIPKEKKTTYVSEPYEYAIPNSHNSVNMITLTQPILQKGRFLGIVTIDISLDSLTQVLKTDIKGSSINLISPRGIETYSDMPAHIMQSKASFSDSAVITAISQVQQNKKATQIIWKDTAGLFRSYFIPADFVNSAERPWVIQINIPVKTIEAPLQQSIRLSLSLSIIILLSVLLVLYLLIKRLTITPFIEIANFTSVMATGDYTKDVPENRLKQQDEVGDIARAFEQFVKKSRIMLGTIKELVKNLKNSNSSLSKNVNKVSAQIVTITGHITSVSTEADKQVTVITEGSFAVNEIHNDAEKLDVMIENQVTAITQSSAAIEQMVGNISSIDSNITKINDQYHQLSEITKQGLSKQEQVSEMVNNIVGFSETLSETNQIISKIAAQTNLLAMNAAIEAAHAGEAGQGFAVVSDEIRKLAENSAKQSKQVKTQLMQIRKGIASIVTASTDSREVFDNIVNQIHDIANLVSEVSGAVAEQNIGSKQVLEGLQIINDVTGKVQTNSKKMKTLSLTALEKMTGAKNISSRMSTSVSEMRLGMDEIHLASTEVSNITNGTTTQVKLVDEAVNKFNIG